MSLDKADTADAEFEAMATIRSLLAGLRQNSRERVLAWAVDYFAIDALRGSAAAPSTNESKAGFIPADGDEKQAGPAGAVAQFADLAALYQAANPRTEAERALVGGFWFQVMQGGPDFGSGEVNKELTQLGFRVSNITRALTELIELRPALVIQVRKSSKAQQAHKRYRVTDQGIRRVQQMLATGNPAPAA
jgi:hypothetical protein